MGHLLPSVGVGMEGAVASGVLPRGVSLMLLIAASVCLVKLNNNGTHGR